MKFRLVFGALVAVAATGCAEPVASDVSKIESQDDAVQSYAPIVRFMAEVDKYDNWLRSGVSFVIDESHFVFHGVLPENGKPAIYIYSSEGLETLNPPPLEKTPIESYQSAYKISNNGSGTEANLPVYNRPDVYLADITLQNKKTVRLEIQQSGDSFSYFGQRFGIDSGSSSTTQRNAQVVQLNTVRDSGNQRVNKKLVDKILRLVTTFESELTRPRPPFIPTPTAEISSLNNLARQIKIPSVQEVVKRIDDILKSPERTRANW